MSIQLKNCTVIFDLIWFNFQHFRQQLQYREIIANITAIKKETFKIISYTFAKPKGEPPKGTRPSAKNNISSKECLPGRAYRSRDLHSDKIAIWEKKVCSLFGQNSKPSIGMYFIKIRFKKIKLNFFSAGNFYIIKQTMFKRYFWSSY